MRRNELGKWGVMFRVKNNLLSNEMAGKIGVSAAYLSNLEHNRKAIPEDWLERVRIGLGLNLPDAVELKIAIIRSRKKATIPVENDQQARLLVAFEKNVERIDEKKASEIQAILEN